MTNRKTTMRPTMTLPYGASPDAKTAMDYFQDLVNAEAEWIQTDHNGNIRKASPVNVVHHLDKMHRQAASGMSPSDIEAFEIARADARVQALWDTRQAALELSRRQRKPQPRRAALKAAKGISPKAWAILLGMSGGLWAFAILSPPALVGLWIAYFILTALAIRWDPEFA